MTEEAEGEVSEGEALITEIPVGTEGAAIALGMAINTDERIVRTPMSILLFIRG